MAVVVAALACTRTPQQRVIHAGESEFGAVRVVERSDGVRLLLLGEGRAIQSAIHPDRPRELQSPYTRVAMIGLALAPADGHMLFVGLGGGAMPTYARHVMPQARLETVEIDPAVVDVASRFFGFRPDDRLTSHVGDGRAFIETAARSWDVIFLDAFSDDEVPYALTTREFLRAVRTRLADGGVVVSNLWTRNPLYDAMLATYLDVFSDVHVIGVPQRAQNIIVAADTRRLDADALEAAARRLAARTELGFDLAGLVASGYQADGAAAASAAQILTDR